MITITKHEHEHEHEGAAIGMPTGAECPSGSTLRYETFDRSFMED